MPAESRVPFGAISRLAGAAASGYVAAQATGAPPYAAALAGLANAACGYLTNRGVSVEDRFEEQVRASRNHHLQLALAGAFQNALEELAKRHPTHQAIFDAWQVVLDAALDQPLALLPAIIPAEFDPLLDATNPRMDQAAAFEEAESLLRYWLAYQKAAQQTGAYSPVPPSAPPKLPADLHQALRAELLPEFQAAFAHLLVQNESAYARRAFERRTSEDLRANIRTMLAILEELRAQRLLPLAGLRPPGPLEGSRELEILRAENRAIPVVGRQEDLAALHAWLAAPAAVSVRILIGGAGSGKTRLGIQLLEELSGSRWHAGFLREAGLTTASERRGDGPTLAIVDYAAAAVQPLKKWLEHLADQPAGPPLRVLLLEREADADSGWLRQLADYSSTGRRIAELLDPPEPQRVTPLGGLEARRQILQATFRRLGATAKLPGAGQDPLFDQQIADARWQDPLYLMMAALVAQKPGSLPQALSLTCTDLAFRLADRELDRIRKFLPSGAASESARLLTYLAGIVTACRGLEAGDLVAIAKEEAGALGLEFPGGPRVAAERVAEALNRGGKPAPIEPDIIGEAVLLRCFGGKSRDEGAAALVRAALRADHRFASSVCFAITRTCQDFAGEECQDPLDWLEEFIRTGQSADFELLLELEGQMPDQTLVLRERAARVDELLLSRFTLLRTVAPSEDMENSYARIVNNLSVRLGALGRPEEALAQAEEAVRIRSQLAQHRPDAFLPNLAASLNNLAGMLSALGRREEALAQAGEAVRIYRQLAQHHPDAFLPNLAMSLSNQAAMLSELGRREEALAQAEESVSIYRQLAQRRPDALPDLALSLNNLANVLSELGRCEEAPAHSGEAVRIYRQLAQHRPDAFLPDLAGSLNTLAAMLSVLGRREEALAHAGEAVRIYRQLAQHRTDAFLPNLAMSLNNLAAMLGALGRREEALAHADEAVRIYRQLAQHRPDAFLPDLAKSLFVRAQILADEQPGESRAGFAESIGILTPFFSRRPHAHARIMAAMLRNYLKANETLGIEPDKALLAPVIAILEKLQEPEQTRPPQVL